MEQLFSTMVGTATAESHSDLMALINPLGVVITGGHMTPPPILASIPFETPLHILFQQGHGHVLTYDPESSTITQSDPLNDPNPSGVSYVYHIDTNSVIDHITVYEHGASVAVFSASQNEPAAGTAADTMEVSMTTGDGTQAAAAVVATSLAAMTIKSPR